MSIKALIVIIAGIITAVFLIWYGITLAYSKYYGKVVYAKELLQEENLKLKLENEQLKKQISETEPTSGNN